MKDKTMLVHLLCKVCRAVRLHVTSESFTICCGCTTMTKKGVTS